MKWILRLLGIEKKVSAPVLETEAAIEERRSTPDPDALAKVSDPPPRPGLDLERLKSLPSAQYQPLTEYLSYIQVKRGETESLVFVRQSDIDALAAMTGKRREDFLNDFKRLGVLISMN